MARNMLTEQIHASIFWHVITIVSLPHRVRNLRKNQLSGTIPNNTELSALKTLYVHYHAMNDQRIRRDMQRFAKGTTLLCTMLCVRDGQFQILLLLTTARPQ